MTAFNIGDLVAPKTQPTLMYVVTQILNEDGISTLYLIRRFNPNGTPEDYTAYEFELQAYVAP